MNHSSTDCNFLLQEVKELEKEDDDQKRDIKQRLAIERDLAKAKQVRPRVD